jgi:hypothetical protein
MKAVQMTEQGGPEVLRLTELPVPAPGPATSTPSAAAPDRPAWQRNSVRSTSTPTSCGWPRAAEQQRATPVVFSTDSELKARRKRPRAEGARTPPPAHLAGRRASPQTPAGGFLPYAATRFTAAAQSIQARLRRGSSPTSSGSTSTPPCHPRRTRCPPSWPWPSRDTSSYGSDFPFAAEKFGTQFDQGLDTYDRWAPGQLEAVNRGNAEVLFPRLASA